MNKLFQACLQAAAHIVAAEKELYPGCEDAVNFEVGGSDSQTNTAFDRQGTSTAQKQFTLPSDLGTAFSNLYNTPSVSAGLSTADTNFLQSILGRDAMQMPGASVLDGMAGLDPSAGTGASTLESIVNRNPYGATYETNTNDLYERSFDKARAAAQSGPANVRGGTARQGFELAELGTALSQNRFKDVTQNQRQDAGVVGEAAQIANAIEASRRGTSLAAVQQRNAGEAVRNQQGLDASRNVAGNRQINLGNLALAADVLGAPKQTQTDNLTGQGQQIQSQFGWSTGLSCCFIFLEAYNGKLPWFVRLGRDTYCTPRVRNGYNWMARFLVPKMRESRLMLNLVNWTMVKPITYFGSWSLAGETNFGWVAKPVFDMWRAVWWVCGQFNKKGSQYGLMA
jgi:hypothetical protein